MINLVNMPFGSITWPSVALGLMKPQLVRAGLPVAIHHLNFELARMIGFGAYEAIARFKGAETQVSEWLFAEAAWHQPVGPPEDVFLQRCSEELDNIPRIRDRIGYLRKIRNAIVPRYLEDCYQRLLRDRPRVVAFSCMFFQTIASLAMGRMLKERNPHIKLVYGGACFHGEMGHELFTKLPWIDVVALGEADEVVVPLFDALLQDKPPRGLPGILTRDSQGEVVEGASPRPTTVDFFETLPDPDYDDFFAEAERVGLRQEPGWAQRASVPFEASRGCWWGERNHCTFCGLNAQGIGHRAKSPERVLGTIRNLAARYDMPRMHATDNILTMSYFKTVLPALIEEPVVTRGKPTVIFFETKANLSRKQIEMLAKAGVTSVQPGIENLATNSLNAIHKGVTALQNAFFLKCAAENGLQVTWNILIRLPGEKPEDYLQMERWIPLMLHLRPPYWGAPRVECHRFSPYHSDRAYTENVRAASWYRGLFPEEQFELDRVAYYFEASWKNTLGDPAYDGVLRLVGEWMRRWREEPEQPHLTMRPRQDGGLEIEDTRDPAEARCWQLSPDQAHIYATLADITTTPKVLAQLPPELAARLDHAAVQTELSNFAEMGLALREANRFMGLALPPTALEESKDLRRVAMQRPANQKPSTLTQQTLHHPGKSANIAL